jgi:hypothetical protein
MELMKCYSPKLPNTKIESGENIFFSDNFYTILFFYVLNI